MKDMKGLKSIDFTMEDDYCIFVECCDCGCVMDGNEDIEACEECESTDIIYNTSHEETKCDCCDKTFVVWESNYYHDEKDITICEHCLNKLRNGEK